MDARGNPQPASQSSHKLRLTRAKVARKRDDQPDWAALPNFSPGASVSAGLCEMNVAMRVELMRTAFVADQNPVSRDDFSDAA